MLIFSNLFFISALRSQDPLINLMFSALLTQATEKDLEKEKMTPT